MPSRAVLYESGAITVYYRVDAGGRLLIGGRGPQHEVSATAAIPPSCWLMRGVSGRPSPMCSGRTPGAVGWR